MDGRKEGRKDGRNMDRRDEQAAAAMTTAHPTGHWILLSPSSPILSSFLFSFLSSFLFLFSFFFFLSLSLFFFLLLLLTLAVFPCHLPAPASFAPSPPFSASVSAVFPGHAAERTRSCGKVLVRSISVACGVSSAATNFCSVSRSSFWVSVSDEMRSRLSYAMVRRAAAAAAARVAGRHVRAAACSMVRPLAAGSRRGDVKERTRRRPQQTRVPVVLLVMERVIMSLS